MITAQIASPVDFEGWRAQARSLLARNIRPEEIVWSDSAAGDLFLSRDEKEDGSLMFAGAARNPSVPAAFLPLARKAILHRHPERFALLYRLLWRIQRERRLLEIAVDPDVVRVNELAKSVRRDQHKMTAFVRFREIAVEHESRFVAWFEPDHHIVEATAEFFIRRFGSMYWSILTPECCAHWDRQSIRFSEGVTKSHAPSEDALEEFWRSYYASIFNPARVKIDAMKKEMPQKYWRNLPEASLIKPLMKDAARRTAAMIAEPATDAPMKLQKLQRSGSADLFAENSSSIETLRQRAAACRACPLWQDATQTVFGEGPPSAEVMFVGEQPGDQEDLSGKPFVGPAGQLFDRALAETGIDREKVYVTNAVKHFKFTPRGKRRIHQKPNVSEMKACSPWLARERETVRPRLIVALGATAAHAIFGKAMPIGTNRGRIVPLDQDTQALITVHPSFLLRVLPEQHEEEYKAFLRDLKLAGEFLSRLRKPA